MISLAVPENRSSTKNSCRRFSSRVNSRNRSGFKMIFLRTFLRTESISEQTFGKIGGRLSFRDILFKQECRFLSHSVDDLVLFAFFGKEALHSTAKQRQFDPK